jgi:hypothetical protein
MFEHFTRYPWVLPTYLYRDEETLLSTLDERVLSPAEAMARELLQPRPGTT